MEKQQDQPSPLAEADPKSLEVKLTSGEVSLVSEEDYERISKLSWYPNIRRGRTYAHTWARGKLGFVSMHRYILGVRGNEIVDHKDGNTLNNTRSNLRIVTHSVNIFRQRQFGKARNLPRGVYKNRPGKFIAVITKNYKRYYLGTFDSPEEASEVYIAKARKLYGSEVEGIL